MRKSGLILILIIICVWWYTSSKSVNEDFADKVPNEFSREQAKDVKIKYPNAYYYEYENDIYNKKLLQIFVPEYERPIFITSTLSSVPKAVTEAFDYITSEIAKRVRYAPELTLENSAPIQVVEKTLLGFKKDTFSIILRFQCVLYREGKFAGKRVEFCVEMRQLGIGLWRTNFLFVGIVDIVPEDKIGIYPVAESDAPFNPDYESPGFVPTSSNKAPLWQQSVNLRAEPEREPRNPAVQDRILRHSSLFGGDTSSRASML